MRGVDRVPPGAAGWSTIRGSPRGGSGGPAWTTSTVSMNLPRHPVAEKRIPGVLPRWYGSCGRCGPPRSVAGGGGRRPDYRLAGSKGWVARSRSPGSGPGFVCRSAGRPNVLLLEHPVVTVPAQRVHPADGPPSRRRGRPNQTQPPAGPGTWCERPGPGWGCCHPRHPAASAIRPGPPPARADRARDHTRASHRPVHSGRRGCQVVAFSPIPASGASTAGRAGRGRRPVAGRNPQRPRPGGRGSPAEGLVIETSCFGGALPPGLEDPRESSRQRI